MKTQTKKNLACDDNLHRYFAQIRTTPLLSFEEELELSRKVQKGDGRACAKLVEANLRLVVKIAKGYIRGGVDIMDLIQEGNIGLMTAAKKYDHKKKVRFCTYAAWWIKQSISRFLATKCRQIRLPYRKDDALRKIQKARVILSHELRRSPSIEEIARNTGMARQEISRVMSLPGTVASLDAKSGSPAGSLLEMCEDYSFSPERSLIEKALAEDTRKFLATLVSRERQILLYRYSFYGNHRYTLKDLSAKIGVSAETIRQIEIRAVRKFREEAQPLREYVSG
jgi:RNA polymerase primary sigma factor